MEHWEFLLQKDGDRSWLPLDSPDVEILEGRYRIVARSSNINATIDTRIAHLATAEVPPKRRVQKRSCHTNHDGLMVVIPFTHLEPGQWELSCSPADLMTDLMTGAQPCALKLQVVAREAEEDWEPDWTSPNISLLEVDASHQAAQEAIAATSEDTVIRDSVGNQVPIVDKSELLPSTTTHDRPGALPPELAEILGASMDRLFQIAEQMSEQLVEEVLQDFDLTTIADAPVSINAVDSIGAVDIDAVETADRAAASAPVTTVPAVAVISIEQTDADSDRLPVGYTLAAQETFVLTLEQPALVATRGEVITLSGQVAIAPTPVQASRETTLSTAPKDVSGDLWDSDVSLNLTGATAQEIQLCLRDPQSLQVLVSDRQLLPHHAFPCPFTFSFSLPDAFITHLVLGEVVLCGTLSESTEAAIALLTQAFSITVDPNALVSELARLHEALTVAVDEEERIDLPLELSSRLKEQSAPSLDLSFLNLAIVEPPSGQAPRFPSLAGQPLPPQLYQPTAEQMRSKTLDLPAFNLPTEATPTLPHATPDPEIASDQRLPESIAVEDGVRADSSSEAASPPQTVETALPSTADVADGSNSPKPVDAEPLKAVSADSTDNPPLDLPSPTHMAFQSLKLQDRFLTRLSSLATDAELSAILKANLTPDSPLAPTTTVPAEAEARPLAEEVVVDDVPPQNERQRKQPMPTSKQSSLDEPPSTLILPADDPVPMPTLDVTTGELTSGKSINIRVKLPNLLPRIYVKLWVTDRQTRSLLDGPRWLVDFLPNGLGDLEAMIPLTVPFGSVELRFEAIAVEMHTQRESHKATTDRVVVPPDLPIVSLDNFND